MLEATQLTGFGADGLPPGPHELFFAGRRSENSSFNYNEGTFDIGLEYADRLVVIGQLTSGGVWGNGAIVNGKAAEWIGGSNAGGEHQWFICKQPPGAGVATIRVNMSGAGASGMMVWVIKGGCGANPVRQIASGYGNNTNSAAGYFSSEVPLNAMVFAIGQKLSTNAFAGIGSNLGGVLTQNANYVTYTGAGYGGGMIDKTTTYRSAGSGYVSSSGSDSSKTQSICAIAINKAA
jgi:hypothetical protein